MSGLVGGVVDLITDPFGRESGKEASQQSQDLGYESLGLQKDWMDYIKGQYEPYSQAGVEALGKQADYLSNIEEWANKDAPTLGSSPSYDDISKTQEFKDINNQAQYSLLNAAEATGGLGSTATGNALGASTSNVLSGLYNQKYGENVDRYNSDMTAFNSKYGRGMDYFNSLGAISGQGMQGISGLGNTGSGVLSGMTGTLSGLGSNALNAAALQQNATSGLLSAGTGLLAAFSDVRLKDNIKATGDKTKNGNEIYTWDWNKEAEKLGLKGKGRGVIADKAKDITPNAVHLDKSGYKKVDYARV